MQFKDKLKKLRIEANLSQEALADLVFVSRSAIAKYENGRGRPSPETLKLLADYFHVDIEELTDDVDIEELTDDVDAPAPKRYRVGLIITLTAGILYVAGAIAACIFYNRVRLTISFSNALLSLGIIAMIVAALIVFGLLALSGYFMMTIKTNQRKLIPNLALFIPLGLALTAGSIGTITTNIQYEEYKTFTSEKWASASNNHDYRGLLIDSFLAQYDIVGYDAASVEDLLGKPDQTTPVKPTLPEQSSIGFLWTYDLGYYNDYMDPTTFDITFSPKNKVQSYQVNYH